MISEKRLAAARANGARSRGPVTAQGKANSSRNSRRHGLRARVLFDDDAKFEDQRIALHTAYLDEFQPNSEFEHMLVEIMALSAWRCARIQRLETELLNDEIRRQKSAAPTESPTTLICLAFRHLADHSCALQILNRLESRFNRRHERALAQLLTIRARPSGFFENTFVNERTHQLTENKDAYHAEQPANAPTGKLAQRPTRPQRQEFMDCRAEKVMPECAPPIQAAIPTFTP